jgi:Tfp pilus assembly PilM family ATPase
MTTLEKETRASTAGRTVENPPDANRPGTLVRRAVEPRKRLTVGRWLAFSIEQDCIEMAAAVRLGRSARILDLRKEYYAGRPDSEEARREFLSSTIRGFVRQFGGRRPTICLAVGGPQTVLRMLELPSMPASKLDSAVFYESRKRIPFPIDECVFDYRVVAKVKRGDRQYLQISVVAVTRELLDNQLALFDRLGLDVHLVYSAYDAVSQLLPAVPDYAPDEDLAVIEVERRGTHIAYYRDRELQFYHVTATGSSFLTEHHDAGRFREFADVLAREIQNSLDYYSGQYAASFGSRVYVHGDLAYAEDLVRQLQDQFGLDFLIFPEDSLPNVQVSTDTLSTAVPVCLNTLAAVSCTAELANLVPPERRARRTRKRWHRLAVAALCLMILLLIAGTVGQYRQVLREQAQLAGLNQQIREFEATDLYAVYMRSKNQLAERAAEVTRLQPVDSHAALALKELTRLTPANITISILRFTPAEPGRNLSLHGVAIDVDDPPELTLAEWIETLEQSPVFEQVHIDRHLKRTLDGRFEIDFIVSLRSKS